mmetsp:Transcript_2773/g.6383  ORF Transcript_2773/g.6383 Transcript_2773/m.6383 type:complete len:243 (-) Transcript_2773:526-1254(-)
MSLSPGTDHSDTSPSTDSSTEESPPNTAELVIFAVDADPLFIGGDRLLGGLLRLVPLLPRERDAGGDANEVVPSSPITREFEALALRVEWESPGVAYSSESDSFSSSFSSLVGRRDGGWSTEALGGSTRLFSTLLRSHAWDPASFPSSSSEVSLNPLKPIGRFVKCLLLSDTSAIFSCRDCFKNLTSVLEMSMWCLVTGMRSRMNRQLDPGSLQIEFNFIPSVRLGRTSSPRHCLSRFHTRW